MRTRYHLQNVEDQLAIGKLKTTMPAEKEPPIAEKVRFWEEQDKINQALIPRLLELHETVAEVVGRLSTIDERFAAIEARTLAATTAELRKVRDSLQSEITATRKRVEDVTQRCDPLQARLDTMDERIAVQEDENKQISTRLALTKVDGGTRAPAPPIFTSYIALAAALLALVISVLRTIIR